MAVARVADRATFLVVASVLLLAHAPRSHALDPAYLQEWPSADQVLADHQGKDRQDTLARQMAALHHLDRSIEDMADARRWHGLTPDENRLRGEYYAAAERIRDEVNSTLSNKLPPGFNGPFAKPPLRKWYALQWKYERDPQVRAQTLGRYISPPLLAQLGANKSAPDARAGKSYVLPLAGLATLALLILLTRSRRRRAAAREVARMQDPAPDVHPDIVAAAEEVMNSLEPYLVMARGGRERIPLRAFTDPFVMAFLVEYCEAALAVVRGHQSGGEQAKLQVLEQLSRNSRLVQLVGGGAESPPSATDRAHAIVGAASARLVLKQFAGNLLNKHMDSDAPRQETDTGTPQPPLDVPPTFLHPAGQHAPEGQRLLMALFVERLLASDDRSKDPA